VAVVLNNAAAPGGSKAWAPEQLTRIERMLRNGLGIDSKRHDKLEVSALDFPPPAMPTPWWKRRSTLIDAGSYLGYSILALLAFLFVLRPLLKTLQQWMRANMGGGVPVPSLPGAPELAAETAATTRVLPAAALLSDASLPPEGSAIDVLVDHLKTLASKDPERVAEVIKQWIRKNDGVG
jgi:flagellar M-ring protein FliF